MSLGSQISRIRKERKIDQGELAEKVGIHPNVLGRYEREEATPSVEVAAKIADALSVTLDYLVKDGQYQNIDNEDLNRLKLIEKLPKEERSHLFATMDAFFAKHKLQSIMQ